MKMNIIIKVDFINERFPLLVDYSINQDNLEILSVRLIRQIINGSQIYVRPDGMYKQGSIYEAVWVYGQPGVNAILSPKQIISIQEEIEKILNVFQHSIPEDQIVHLAQ